MADLRPVGPVAGSTSGGGAFRNGGAARPVPQARTAGGSVAVVALTTPGGARVTLRGADAVKVLDAERRRVRREFALSKARAAPFDRRYRIGRSRR